MNWKLCILAALTALALSACGRPQYLVENQMVAGRNVKGILATGASGGEKGQLYDLSVRICDVDANGAESNCQTSLVLTNVQPGSIY
ncbi:MAG: hypothetical protein AB1938_23560 [Myxococcota bacterium]